MSVMIYDTANGAFKYIQAMQRYDPSANAWTDCTSAQVQENGVWVEKLSTSAYVYGAVNETVTIKKDGKTIATVQTNSNGVSDEKLTLKSGVYTLTGSVSGQSFTRTVTSETTDVYAMPEGLVLYWYGVKNPNLQLYSLDSSGRKDGRSVIKNTNSIFYGITNQNGWYTCVASPKIPINATTINFTLDVTNTYPYYLISTCGIASAVGEKVLTREAFDTIPSKVASTKTYSVDISSFVGLEYHPYIELGSIYMNLYAIWFE